MQKSKHASYLGDAARAFRSLRSLVGGGLLAAVGIVLKIFTLPITATLRIGFNFLSIAVSAFLYGPLMGGCVGALIDILGFLISPTGPYFPGFTFNAFLNGFICGLFLWRRPVRFWRVLAACSTCIVVVNLLINPYWLYLLYGGSYFSLMLLRVPTNAIMLPAYTVLVYLLTSVLEKQTARLAQ